MKRIILIVFTVILIAGSNVLYCQYSEIPLEINVYLKSWFLRDWVYFRMQKNPILPYQETHDEEGRWRIPFLIPDKFYQDRYRADIKISRWDKFPGSYNDLEGKQHNYRYVAKPSFYLIEKGDGLLGLKINFYTKEILDSMQVDIANELFPYDNRFMAVDIGGNKFTFHSGNVTWGEWRDIGYTRQVDFVGYVRGVQFGVELMRPFIWGESQAIRRLRPEYPDYVYAHADRSLLSSSHLLVAAPEGKEDQLVEFIYYTNKPDKTGDDDLSHFYEMRYILPTQIKTIKERRLEKRLLRDDEKQMLFNPENKMFFFIDPLRMEEPVEIIGEE